MSAGSEGRIILSHAVKTTELLVLTDSAGAFSNTAKNSKEKEINALAFVADSTLLASGGNDQKVKIWDLK